MDNKEKKNSEKMFEEGDFPFAFGRLEKMAEMMRHCCGVKGDMADCCSMMKKMMQFGEGEGPTKKKDNT